MSSIPDVAGHRPEADYARSLIERARKVTGLGENKLAERIDVTDRSLRAYKSGAQPMPYLVQFALEQLAGPNGVHEPAPAYRADTIAGTIWIDPEKRPLSDEDVGKLLVGKDRYGYGVFGPVSRDGFGLRVDEFHPQAVDVRSVPANRIAIYALLDPPPGDRDE